MFGSEYIDDVVLFVVFGYLVCWIFGLECVFKIMMLDDFECVRYLFVLEWLCFGVLCVGIGIDVYVFGGEGDFWFVGLEWLGE